MATLPKLDDSPLLPSPTASLRGISLDSSGVASAAISAEKEKREGLRYIARGMNDIGDALDEVQLADDKRAAKDQLTEYSASLRTLLHGDGTDANPGYYNLKGDDAVNGRTQLEGSILKMRQDYLGKAKNKRSGMFFNDASITLTAPELENVSIHAGREKKVAETASSLAAMNEAISRFSANPSPDSADMNGLIVQQEALAQADAAGIRDPKTRDALARTALSKMYQEGISTALQRDVDAGQAMYLQYRDKIDGQDQSAIENDIHVAQRARQAEIEHKAVMGRLAAEQADKAAFDEWVTKLGTPGANVSIPEIASDRRMDGRSKLTLYGVIEANDKGDTPAGISRATTANLYAQMLPNSDGTPSEITEADIIRTYIRPDHPLNRTDFEWLLKAHTDMRTVDGQKLSTEKKKFFDSVAPSIIKYTPAGIADKNGAANFYGYQQYVEDKLAEARKNKEDPYELLRAGSPKFLGAPEVIGQFQGSAQDVVRQQSNSLSGKTTPLDKVPPIYKTVDDVGAAYRTGKVTKEAYIEWLENNGFKHKAP
jgi:hypothetical protein